MSSITKWVCDRCEMDIGTKEFRRVTTYFYNSKKTHDQLSYDICLACWKGWELKEVKK